jgi:hypothetical protein
MRALLSLILAVVAGCATVGADKVEELKPGTAIAPLSLMGETLAVRHVGTTVFQNERRDIGVAKWQIDRHTESAAGRMLSISDKFKVVAADSDRARKAAGKMETDFWSGGAKLQGGEEAVTSYAKDSGAHYVLLIGPAQLGDPFMGTNQSFSGYGVYQRGFLGSRRALNYLTMRTVLLDGKTGAELARTHGFLSVPRQERDWMEADNLVLTVENETSTKAGIEQLIESVLRKCLTDLKLVQ